MHSPSRNKPNIRFVPPFISVFVDCNLHSILLVNDDFILMGLKEYISRRAWEDWSRWVYRVSYSGLKDNIVMIISL